MGKWNWTVQMYCLLVSVRDLLNPFHLESNKFPPCSQKNHLEPPPLQLNSLKHMFAIITLTSQGHFFFCHHIFCQIFVLVSLFCTFQSVIFKARSLGASRRAMLVPPDRWDYTCEPQNQVALFMWWMSYRMVPGTPLDVNLFWRNVQKRWLPFQWTWPLTLN